MTSEPRRDCSRCGWRDRPGHGCTRYWGIPHTAWGVSRSGFRRKGKLSCTYWALHWKWCGDIHKFIPALSLGEHLNVSARSRRDERERREYEAEFSTTTDAERTRE